MNSIKKTTFFTFGIILTQISYCQEEIIALRSAKTRITHAPRIPSMPTKKIDQIKFKELCDNLLTKGYHTIEEAKSDYIKVDKYGKDLLARNIISQADYAELERIYIFDEESNEESNTALALSKRAEIEANLARARQKQSILQDFDNACKDLYEEPSKNLLRNIAPTINHALLEKTITLQDLINSITVNPAFEDNTERTLAISAMSKIFKDR